MSIDEVGRLIIPDDLLSELERREKAEDYFLSLSKSSKKSLMHYVVVAKKGRDKV